MLNEPSFTNTSLQRGMSFRLQLTGANGWSLSERVEVVFLEYWSSWKLLAKEDSVGWKWISSRLDFRADLDNWKVQRKFRMRVRRGLGWLKGRSSSGWESGADSIRWGAKHWGFREGSVSCGGRSSSGWESGADFVGWDERISSRWESGEDSVGWEGWSSLEWERGADQVGWCWFLWGYEVDWEGCLSE